MAKKIISQSNCQTKQFASKIAKELVGGEILALSGDLGSGKTTFTQGLAKGLGINEKVTSPTFVLMKQYRVRVNLPAGKAGSKSKEKKNLIQKQGLQSDSNLLLKPLALVHIDAYRMKDEQDALGIGITDYLGRSDIITVIEWPEKVKKILPKGTIWVKFEHVNGSSRLISINN